MILRAAVGACLALTLVSCAHGSAGRGSSSATAPVPDSATVGLWRMDEPGGYLVADEGPFRLTARAGIEARTDFGRFAGARVFGNSIESFLYVPFTNALDSGDQITVEAWIDPSSLGRAELMPIVERWSPLANEQSWLFGIVGLNLARTGTSTGFLHHLVANGSPGRLVFALQPLDASLPVSYFSSDEIALSRWTHVAVSFDGREVRFYIDGRLDSQYALTARIRPTPAPLMIGNYFDSRWITEMEDRPQVVVSADRNAFYAFDGAIDELRISRIARDGFAILR
jgi:hypothetical protein